MTRESRRGRTNSLLDEGCIFHRQNSKFLTLSGSIRKNPHGWVRVPDHCNRKTFHDNLPSSIFNFSSQLTQSTNIQNRQRVFVVPCIFRVPSLMVGHVVIRLDKIRFSSTPRAFKWNCPQPQSKCSRISTDHKHFDI